VKGLFRCNLTTVSSLVIRYILYVIMMLIPAEGTTAQRLISLSIIVWTARAAGDGKPCCISQTQITWQKRTTRNSREAMQGLSLTQSHD
jgi:hypothetical protein